HHLDRLADRAVALAGGSRQLVELHRRLPEHARTQHDLLAEFADIVIDGLEIAQHIGGDLVDARQVVLGRLGDFRRRLWPFGGLRGRWHDGAGQGYRPPLAEWRALQRHRVLTPPYPLARPARQSVQRWSCHERFGTRHRSTPVVPLLLRRPGGTGGTR